MNAGEFNRQIVLGAMTDGIDPETGRDCGSVFVPEATVWARIRYVRGDEYFRAAAVHAERTVTFTIRWRPGVTTKTVISYNGDCYDVRAINDQSEKHEILILQCEER